MCIDRDMDIYWYCNDNNNDSNDHDDGGDGDNNGNCVVALCRKSEIWQEIYLFPYF